MLHFIFRLVSVIFAAFSFIFWAIFIWGLCFWRSGELYNAEKMLDKSLAAKADIAKEMREQAKEERTEKKIQKSYDEARPIIEEATKTLEANKSLMANYRQIRELSKEDGTLTGSKAGILKRLGIENIVTNDKTQLIAKESAKEVIEDLSKIRTGGKTTNMMIQDIERQVPTVMNSPYAMDAISVGKMYKIASEDILKEELTKTASEYQKANLELPITWEKEAADRVSPIRDELLKKTADYYAKVIRKINGEETIEDAYPIKWDPVLKDKFAPPGSTVEWDDGKIYGIVNGRWHALNKKGA